MYPTQTYTPQQSTQIKQCELLAQQAINLSAEAAMLEWSGVAIQSNKPDVEKEYVLQAITEEVKGMAQIRQYTLDLAQIAMDAIVQQDQLSYDSAVKTMTEDIQTSQDRYKVVCALYDRLISRPNQIISA